VAGSQDSLWDSVKRFDSVKILYFAPHQMWPLITGNRLRDYHLARELAARSEVTFMEMLHAQDDRAAKAPQSAGFARVVTVEKERNFTPLKVLRGLIGPVPVTVLNYYSQRTADVLAEVLRTGDFDIVQLESVQLSTYIPIIRAAASRPRIVADWHNIESELMARYGESTRSVVRKLVAGRTAGLLHATEQRWLTECDAHTVPSERERGKLLERARGVPVHVIPNGVDTAHYAAEALQSASADAGAGAPPGRSILFVGLMEYHANISGVEWFVREVWPGIASRHPDLNFIIVGRNPGPGIRALASDRVQVTGTVADVRPYYAHAAAVVVPLHVGGGTRLKILEAMAAGVPVVSTALGAEGIECENGTDLLIANTAEEMTAAADRVLTSRDFASGLVESARRLVTRRYDWTAIGAQLHAVHEQLAIQRHAPQESRRA
jgi:polysaccharide biosynthesis protein PslH